MIWLDKFSMPGWRPGAADSTFAVDSSFDGASAVIYVGTGFVVVAAVQYLHAWFTACTLLSPVRALRPEGRVCFEPGWAAVLDSCSLVCNSLYIVVSRKLETPFYLLLLENISRTPIHSQHRHM